MQKKTLALIIFLCITISSSSAFEAANPYWIALQPKLKAFLSKNIDSSKYSYSIYGPARDLTNFLGNAPNHEIRFSNINLTSPGMRKTVFASAYDASGKKLDSLPIYIDIKVYKKILTLKNSVAEGAEITPDNIVEKTIEIDPRDEHLYYNSGLAQKVAGKSMKAGDAIKINQVRHEKLIQVGDSIKVTNGNKMIRLEFFCKAMKSGDLNEIITVHCPDLQTQTRKAKLVSEAEAEFI